MGVDWFPCDNCGETICDAGDYVSCECGKTWCSYECAEEDGWIDYEDEDYEGEIPIDKEYGGELSSSCKYCREEDFDDLELLNFALEIYGNTRGNLIKEYKEWKEDK